MNKAQLRYWFSLLVFSFLFLSCKVQEKENIKIKIKPRSSKYLVNKLLINEFQFNTISAKAPVELTDTTGKKTDFKTHIRIKQDSAIWISITPLLGIEMARVLITKDTVKLLNRVKKEYFIGDFEYINKLFGSDLDYQMIEALLIGNSLDFEMEEKIHSKVDRKKGLYYLSTVKKRIIKKELEKDKDKLKDQAQALWLDPETFKIKEILLSTVESDNTLTGVYEDYRELGSQILPYEMLFTLQSKTTVKIGVEYTKFTTGKVLTFPFKIPTKYEQINL